MSIALWSSAPFCSLSKHTSQCTFQALLHSLSAHHQSGQSCRSWQTRRGKALSATEPWYIGHQTNERLLRWDDSAQRSLIKIYVARELGKDPEWVEEQLALLREMLPEVLDRLEQLKATLVLSLVSDTAGVAAKLVRLKGLLPQTDVPALVARHTRLLSTDPAAMAASLDALRAALGDSAQAEALVAREPALLGADVDALLSEVRRLLPKQNPVEYLVTSPGSVLSMAQAGLESAIDGNLV